MAKTGTTGTPKKERDAAKQNRFISRLRATANVSAACKAAGVARRTAYRWKDEIEAFAEAWEDALTEATDDLEEEARRRAVKGTPRKQFYQGVPVIDPATKKQYVEHDYSDTLLIFLLKAHRPEKYRETVKVKTWQDEIITLLKEGKISADDVKRELGDELADPILVAAGASGISGSKAGA